MDFSTPQPVIAELTRRVQHGIFGYTDPKESYKQTIVDWMTEHHDWTPSTKALTITPGVVFALATAVRCFTKPGDAVLLQQPVYYPFSEVIRQNGRQLVNSPLVLKDGHYEIDFADFEDKIVKNNVKLFLLCSPHNPAGRVWTREELLRIASICLKRDVLIVSDEIHEEFVRPGFRHTVLASLSPEIAAQTITCTSPSKTFNLAGLQISNIFIENDELRKRFRAEISAAGYSQPNALGLFAAQAAYAEGGSWLKELLAYIEGNYKKTKAFLAEKMPKVTLIEPEGTYLLWLDFSAYGLSDEELDDIIINDANLWLDSGHIFGKAGRGFQRLNIACPGARSKMASSIWPRPLRTADSLIQKGRIHMLCIGLSPSIDKDCRALILGSMPGVKSLEEQQYYAHPQNRFWPMMADLLGEALPSRYEEKLAMLLDHHIALWDSIGQCEREGSLDSAIREERGNDFTALLQAYPAIRAIFFNGGKSSQAFRRHNKALLQRPDIAFYAMPSTSPANARWRLPMLEETWRKALTEAGILCYTESKK